MQRNCYEGSIWMKADTIVTDFRGEEGDGETAKAAKHTWSLLHMITKTCCMGLTQQKSVKYVQTKVA